MHYAEGSKRNVCSFLVCLPTSKNCTWLLFRNILFTESTEWRIYSIHYSWWSLSLLFTYLSKLILDGKYLLHERKNMKIKLLVAEHKRQALAEKRVKSFFLGFCICIEIQDLFYNLIFQWSTGTEWCPVL